MTLALHFLLAGCAAPTGDQPPSARERVEPGLGGPIIFPNPSQIFQDPLESP